MDENKFTASVSAVLMWLGGVFFMTFAAPPPPTATEPEMVVLAVIYVFATGVLAALFGVGVYLVSERYPKKKN